ncbi:hypothetical protein N7E02_18365 [Aliirhizobium terrae]|uniref:hypothetical protein n=1 Tax=Terrirhizobium terrae TaxID=2926709 RepID=UPI002578311E|nr:hypothetical protein [Rhizobium sp. CC-CFT758]WJH38901.1 hypothetical protein N7E02_18365 [Rhizobium sp. CC-CFT758]
MEENFLRPKQSQSLACFEYIMERLGESSEALRTLEDDYRRRLNRILADLYGISLELIENEQAWELFREHDSWAGMALPADAKRHALRYVLKWACNQSRAGKQKANFYLRALKAVAKEDTKPADLPQKIERAGGLKKAASAKVMAPNKTEVAMSDRAKRPQLPDHAEGENKKQIIGAFSEAKQFQAMIVGDLNATLQQWATMKIGTRFVLTGVLVEMKAPAKITVEALEIL